jgi:hypothetical protein
MQPNNDRNEVDGDELLEWTVTVERTSDATGASGTTAAPGV